jgi:hypothetical protein
MAVRRLAFVVLLLCVPRFVQAQVDLTRPLPADEYTMELFHLDDVAEGKVQDAAGGPAGSAQDAVSTIGRFGGALSCNGVGGWIDVPDQPAAAPGAGLTVECWVKFPERAAGDIICRNRGYMFRLSGTVTAYIGLDGEWRTVTGSSDVPVGRWTHLAMTYDHATREVRVYIDGKLDVAAVPRGVTAGQLELGSSVLRLGANTWSASGSAMVGKLDEVRISNVARTYTPLYPTEEAPVPDDTNLVGNPSFESGIYGRRITREGNGRLLWHVESGDAAQGRAFLRASQPDAHSLISYPFRVARGKTHTVSVSMRSDTPCRAVAQLRLIGGRGGRGGGRAGTASAMDIGPQWKRFWTTFDVPADIPGDTAYVEVGTRDDAIVDIDAVSVVAGQGTEYTQTEAQSIGLDADLPQQRTYMLNAGAQLPIKLTNTGAEDRDLSLGCTVTDWRGQEVAQARARVGAVPAGQTAQTQVELPDGQAGWFVAHFTVRADRQTIKQTDRPYNVIEPMQGVGGVMDSQLGMNTHMEREPTEHLQYNAKMLALCGVKWIRAWWGWGMAEKEPGQFDWTEYDRQLKTVQDAGMEIMPILLRYYPQYEFEWSGAVDRIQRPPRDLDQWASFVRTTAEHYRGRVKAWEVWNEANYTMEPDYYAGLVKVTYEQIKAVDPDATVIGFGGVAPDYIRRAFEAGAAKYMDVISLHSYAELGRPYERMANLAAAVERLAQQFGSTHRVWHTEQGSGADSAGYRASPQTEEQCAINLAQSYLSALSTGAEKFFWFSAQTTPTYGDAVFYEDYVPRPRLVALNGLARVLKGRRVTGRADLGEGKVACVLMDGEAGAAAALWNLGEQMTLCLPAGTAGTWTDMLGNPMPAEATAQPIKLELGRPVYLLTDAPGADRLANVLKQADIELVTPVSMTANMTADGKLEIGLTNVVADNLDLRIGVRAPALFTEPAVAVVLADLAPGETRKVVFEPGPVPAAGREVRATVQVEIGAYGIRTISSTLTVGR